MKKQIARALFFILGVINLTGHLLAQEDLIVYSKVLLMPLLLYYVYESTRETVTFRTLLLAVAIIFSWGGDIALIYPRYFLLGVGLFLIAQITYSYLFLKSTTQSVSFNLLRILPFVLYATLLFYLVLPDAGDMKIPVIVYGICLLAMGYTASLRKGLTQNQSFKVTLSGAVLFIISDSLIALSKFTGTTIPHSGFLIMLTYIIAQYLIVEGMIKHTD